MRANRGRRFIANITERVMASAGQIAIWPVETTVAFRAHNVDPNVAVHAKARSKISFAERGSALKIRIIGLSFQDNDLTIWNLKTR
jgi:hypothetical protein